MFHTLKKYCQKAKIHNSSIILEMTERKFMLDSHQQNDWLNKYKKLGFKFAIDDFGTGYSNLSYLSAMPIDYLKIDRSFIVKIGEDEKSEEIIKATIAIAKALNQKTIAEGVELESQYKFLKEHGCDYIQGYYFSEPKPLDKIEDFIKKHL